MPRARLVAFVLIPILTASLAAFAAPPAPAADPESVVHEAMAAAQEIPAQATVLAQLAWEQPRADPGVAAFARQKLVGFGALAMPALRAALPKVRPEAQADVARALIEANSGVRGKQPPDYLPGLEEAVWYGGEAARRIAIPELARYRYDLGVLTIIDAAYEMPVLVPLCTDALGQIGSDRARFFLEKQMQEGKGEIPSMAAGALARIGGKALLPLKGGMRSDRRIVREAAARAFVHVAAPEDASALHEYVASHPNDDEATVRSVREAAIMLEKIREAKEAAESSSAAETP